MHQNYNNHIHTYTCSGGACGWNVVGVVVGGGVMHLLLVLVLVARAGGGDGSGPGVALVSTSLETGAPSSSISCFTSRIDSMDIGLSNLVRIASDLSRAEMRISSSSITFATIMLVTRNEPY